ncbi:hypothetical protein BGW38_002307 [Lunasporangiospora selenospora]|uniref:Major facilitator superfamily (MFS) profile domain-containing protein n=1 Tax=Lunasporangiospora selenospora TaxID=979761 RepID=A0A9P6G5F9_9FUNG|nr:hypothetical protein BGW38_002307 [Lunasporangiospora selenospora]
MALSIFYIGYVIGEVPSNMMLRKFGPRKWIPIVIFLWGTIMMAMAAVKSAAGLYASRFFLGLAEAGYAPAPVFVISLWYIRSEQAIRIGLFFSAATVAGAFGGLLAYAITRMEGILGLTGWQWIFIIEGFLTIIASVVAYFRLPDLPSKATFLTPDEKQLALQRLEFDSGHVQDTTFSRKQFYSAFVDWRVYFFMAIGLLHHVSFAALGLFIPSIVRGFGYDAVTTQIMTVPIYAIACLFTLTAAFSADRNKERGLHIVAASFFSAIGYLILILTRHSLTAARYTGLVICTSGMYAFIPCFLSWPAANIAGATKRGVAIALVISISHIGSITGGQLYRSDDAPLYKRGHIVSASTMVLVGLLALILRSILKRENKRRERLSPQEYMVECDKVDQAEDHPGFRFYT